jgi:hypothetical protein
VCVVQNLKPQPCTCQTAPPLSCIPSASALFYFGQYVCLTKGYWSPSFPLCPVGQDDCTDGRESTSFLKKLYCLLDGDTLWHLQKLLQYIKYIILESPPPPRSQLLFMLHHPGHHLYFQMAAKNIFNLFKYSFNWKLNMLFMSHIYYILIDSRQPLPIISNSSFAPKTIHSALCLFFCLGKHLFLIFLSYLVVVVLS